METSVLTSYHCLVARTCEQPCSQSADRTVGTYEPVNINLTKHEEHSTFKEASGTELRDWLLPLLMNGQVTVR